MTPVLLTGGAGYIGSHVTLALQAAGRPVVVLDNLSTGRREAIPDGVPFVEGDIADRALVARTVAEHGIDSVLHFAGLIEVEASVSQPMTYYEINVGGSQALLASCQAAGVSKFIFSSTAAVYGEPEEVPVDEDMPTVPVNPYGRNKLIVEWMLRDLAAAADFRYVALRYFNVAGADPEGRSGQRGSRSTHLIKVACELATGKRPSMTMFGDDYDTPDGTCVRDYIHVSDLAAAHVLALDYLDRGGDSQTLNCGYGRGFSVREVLDVVRQQADKPLDIRTGPRRPGDSACLISNPSRLKSLFDWQPRFDDLDTIVASALAWERRLLSEAAATSNG